MIYACVVLLFALGFADVSSYELDQETNIQPAAAHIFNKLKNNGVNDVITKWSPMNLVRTLQDTSRITNGEMAALHQFPWQAALYITAGENKTVFCGGSLIHEEWVLTAAHCVEGFLKFKVVLGAHNLTKAEDDVRQVFEVDKLQAFVHPQWNNLELLNDIAMLKLPSKAKLNDYVKPIDITDGISSLESVGRKATVSGWGRTSDETTGISDVLQFASQPIVSELWCKITYFGTVGPTHICISGRWGKSSCNGDSGGPLIVYEDDTPKQIGIVSFGISFGCQVGWPSVYTRVSSYIDYIHNVMITY